MHALLPTLADLEPVRHVLAAMLEQRHPCSVVEIHAPAHCVRLALTPDGGGTLVEMIGNRHGAQPQPLLNVCGVFDVDGLCVILCEGFRALERFEAQKAMN